MDTDVAEQSLRLTTIGTLIKPCRCLADVGCDHAFVAIHAVSEGKAERAIASDVNRGPLERAEEHIRERGLSDRISLRLGSGFSPYLPGECDAAVIAGMGGMLIERILSEGDAVVSELHRLILSPHTDLDLVRAYLMKRQFLISDERMLSEEGKYYTILSAEKCEHPVQYTEAELLYGPVLLSERPEVFLRYLSEERRKAEALFEKLRSIPESASILEARNQAEEKLRLLSGIL